MGNGIISKSQAICLIFLFIVGSSLAVPTGVKAGNDVWLASLLALMVALVISLIYSRLLTRYRGYDLFDILQSVFGKVLGKILILISVWYIFHLGVLVMRDEGDIITTLTLPETPSYVSLIMLILVCVLGGKQGIAVLGRCSIVFTMVIFSMITFVILMLIPHMNFNNLMPVLYDGIKPTLQGTASTLSFLLDVVIFTIVLSSVQRKSNIYSVFALGILLAGIAIFLIGVLEILTLGTIAYTSTYYPLYSVVSMIKIGFIERIDFIAVIMVSIAQFVKITICLICVSVGICKIFNFTDYRLITLPVGLLMLNLSLFIHESVMEKTQWIATFGFLYFIPFQVILPILLLITAEIRDRIKKASN